MPWFRHDEGVLNRGDADERFLQYPARTLPIPLIELWMGLKQARHPAFPRAHQQLRDDRTRPAV